MFPTSLTSLWVFACLDFWPFSKFYFPSISGCLYAVCFTTIKYQQISPNNTNSSRTGRYPASVFPAHLEVLSWSRKLTSGATHYWCVNEAHQQFPQAWVSDHSFTNHDSDGGGVHLKIQVFTFQNWIPSPLLSLWPLSLQGKYLPDSGVIEDASIWFLKGAARIQTAMATVIAFDSLGYEAGC